MANGYQYELSNETRNVLTDNVKEIAYEMGVTTNYLHQILASNETDVFSKFLRLFTACVKAGVDVTPWMSTLSSIRATADRNPPFKELIAEKAIHDNTTTAKLVLAERDGQIDENEAREIRHDLEKEREILDVIDNKLPRISNIRDYAKRAVNGRRR
jgi:hypothetical protein